MVAAALGTLLVKMKGVGIAKVGKQLAGFQSQFSKLSKKMKPALGALQKGWLKMGAVAGLALWRLTQASPRLKAQMEILNMRTNQLLREFGDGLAPVIDIVADGIKNLTGWFKSLPEPVQEAIKFGAVLAITIGLLAGAFAALSLAASPVTLAILAIAAAGAILYLMFETNFGGIKDITERVLGRIGELLEKIMGLFGGLGGAVGQTGDTFTRVFGIIETIAGTFFENIASYIENSIKTFEGIIDFLTAIFKGDWEGALEAIGDILESVWGTFKAVILWPLTFLQGLLKGLTGVDIIGDMMDAGEELIAAFLEGALAAIEDAGQLVKDVLDWLGSFFGGSLPERGPLKHIDKMGQEFGTAYVKNIGSGVARENISKTINRNFRISTVNVTAQGSDLVSPQRFGEKLSTGVRMSTRW